MQLLGFLQLFVFMHNKGGFLENVSFLENSTQNIANRKMSIDAGETGLFFSNLHLQKPCAHMAISTPRSGTVI